MAEYLQIAQPSYIRYENGSSEPSLENLVKIADYFDCSADYLLGRDYAAELLADEQQLLHDYRELDASQKKSVLVHAADLAKLAHFEDAEALKKDDAL